LAVYTRYSKNQFLVSTEPEIAPCPRERFRYIVRRIFDLRNRVATATDRPARRLTGRSRRSSATQATAESDTCVSTNLFVSRQSKGCPRLTIHPSKINCDSVESLHSRFFSSPLDRQTPPNSLGNATARVVSFRITEVVVSKLGSVAERRYQEGDPPTVWWLAPWSAELFPRTPFCRPRDAALKGSRVTSALPLVQNGDILRRFDGIWTEQFTG
jgi:hypothetical protein